MSGGIASAHHRRALLPGAGRSHRAIGWRVTLTFNLLTDGEADTQRSGPVADLERCLTEHFAAPATPRHDRTDLDPPNRLVYLLDHEYTQRGLNWNRLKGADAERAALLRAAAERVGVSVRLLSLGTRDCV